jgi:hypothetical protein
MVVLENQPEMTDDFAKLGPALDSILARLWGLYSRK